MSQVQYVHTGCPRCGNRMTYEGGKKALKCGRCKYRRELGRNTEKVQNHPLTSGIKWQDFSKGLQLDLFAFQCGSCKAIITQVEESPPASCPFCKGEEWKESGQVDKIMEPFGMMPFAISKTSAREKLKKWLNPRGRFPFPSAKWWYPKGIYGVLEEENLKGLYLPLFFADVFSRSTWTGKAGFQHMKEQKGKVVKSRVYEPVAGYYENFFQDQFQADTKGVDKHFTDILPYEIKNVVSFNSQHLAHWPVEVYPSQEGEILKKIEKRVDKRIEREAKKRSKGEGVKDLKIQSEKFLITLRHVLVPVWIATYYYQGNRYQFLVNGQSGKVAGNKPLSFLRIALSIGIAALIMIVIAGLMSV